MIASLPTGFSRNCQTNENSWFSAQSSSSLSPSVTSAVSWTPSPVAGCSGFALTDTISGERAPQLVTRMSTAAADVRFPAWTNRPTE